MTVASFIRTMNHSYGAIFSLHNHKTKSRIKVFTLDGDRKLLASRELLRSMYADNTVKSFEITSEGGTIFIDIGI